MEHENIIMDLNSVNFKKEINKTPLSVILDTLPFGLSVQNKKRIVIYENQKAKELTGSYKDHQCFTRWNYLPGEGEKVCKDCPASITLLDGKHHKIFRKTVTQKKEDVFLEIHTIPIVEKDHSIDQYIEIIYDITTDEKVKLLTEKSITEIIDNLQFSMSIYGDHGGEILFRDKLEYFEDPNYYVQKLSMFTYIGVFQNHFDREGLFGPLPVLDILDYCMMVYSCNLQSSKVKDPRKRGREPVLLLTYFDRKNYLLFEKRDQLVKYLNKKIKDKKIEELDENWFNEFKNDFKNELLNEMNGIKDEDEIEW